MTTPDRTSRRQRYSPRAHALRERHVFDFTGAEAVHQTVHDDVVVAEERFENPVPAMVADFAASLADALEVEP